METIFYKVFMGSEPHMAADGDAWDYALDQDAVVQKLDNVMSGLRLCPGEDFTIVIQREEE